MIEMLLEQLKTKYEYLDFNNAKVLECFYNAIEGLKNDIPHTFENENTIILELEHYFLYYLVLEIQKGNEEIYDAVSIRMESVYDFFLRKRKDLVLNTPYEKQRELYFISFRNAINMYYKRMRFPSLLIRCLIDVYREQIENDRNIKQYVRR